MNFFREKGQKAKKAELSLCKREAFLGPPQCGVVPKKIGSHGEELGITLETPQCAGIARHRLVTHMMTACHKYLLYAVGLLSLLLSTSLCIV